MLCEILVRTAHPAPKRIPIITKNATTQTRATALSCSGVGRVIPIASMMPLVSEIRKRINIVRRYPHYYRRSSELRTNLRLWRFEQRGTKKNGRPDYPTAL